MQAKFDKLFVISHSKIKLRFSNRKLNFDKQILQYYFKNKFIYLYDI